ncbi:hypothetical protein SK128_012789, partial [Halocaridina rubra]
FYLPGDCFMPFTVGGNQLIFVPAPSPDQWRGLVSTFVNTSKQYECPRFLHDDGEGKNTSFTFPCVS